MRPNDHDGAVLHRRRLLQATAAGAAVAWSAPAITTLGLTPAAAASAAGSCPVPTILPFQGVTTFTYAGPLSAGADLTENDASPYSNNATGYVFNETGPIEIPAGGYNSETAFIPAGTWVCSIFIHGSPTSGTRRYRGTLQIPGSTILGYDGHTANLNNSDPLFAVPGVNYNGFARQHEWNPGSGGSGDYYGQVASNVAEFRMAVQDRAVDQGRLFVACL